MRRFTALLAGFVSLLFALVSISSVVAAPSRALAQQPFTLLPGGRATISFEAYCTEFGKLFPQQILPPTGDLAPDDIRAALDYIGQNDLGADVTTALDANYAIWSLTGAQGLPAASATTQDVLDNASTAPTDPAGISIFEAADDGKVTITLGEWSPASDKVQILSAQDNFYGRGTLIVENTSTESLELFMPTGTLFPGSETRFQVMGGFAIDVDVNNPTLPNTSGSGMPLIWLLGLALALLTIGQLMQRPLRNS
jgi:hypothetical protein